MDPHSDKPWMVPMLLLMFCVVATVTVASVTTAWLGTSDVPVWNHPSADSHGFATPSAAADAPAPENLMELATAGEAHFNATCVACHTLGEGPKVGPDLAGLYDRRDRAWVDKWMADPMGMGQNDPIGKQLMAEWKNVPMPPTGLDDQQTAEVLAYIEVGGKLEATATVATNTPPTNDAPAPGQSKPTTDRPVSELWGTCGACHGPNGEGKTGTGPALNNQDFLAASSDEFLRKTISEGRPGTTMVAFNTQMSDKEIDKVVAKIRGWQTVPSVALDSDYKAAGDAKNGAVVFEQVCGKCHGPHGEGYSAGGSGTAIGNKQFLAVASDAYIKYIVKNGREGTPMRSFYGPDGIANLSDSDIDDVITYLRSM